jgi:hypothetical protein
MPTPTPPPPRTPAAPPGAPGWRPDLPLPAPPGSHPSGTGGAGPPGYPPPGPPSRRRGWWLLAGIGVLVVLALLAGVVGLGRDGGGDDAAGRRSGTSAPAPSTTAPPVATEAELDAAVADISAFVEDVRGLTFEQPVDVELLGEGDFQDRLLADFDEDADELRKDEVLLKGLGLVPPDVDLVDAMRSLLGAGVVGFYDPETAALVVRGTALTPYVRTTIAHELTHALDDQHFDLSRPAYDEATDEIGFGFGSVVEGDARRVENAYRDSLSRAERADAAAEEMRLASDYDIGAIPPVLVELIGAPYTYGEEFVDDLVDDGGEDELAGALAAPPHTSEQVLYPDKFRENEGPVDVPHPEVAGEVVDEGVAGELLLALLLADEIGADDAVTTTTGWGGDWAVAWIDAQGRPCTTITVVGDNARETAELRDGVDSWVEGRGQGATITQDDARSPMTVESCAATAPSGSGGGSGAA